MQRTLFHRAGILSLVCFTLTFAGETLRVGVLPVTHDGTKAAESADIVARMTDALGAYAFIRLVKQEKLSAVLREIEKGMTGIQDESTIAKAGKLHGVQVLISGNVSGGKVFFRAIHVETGRILSSSSANISDVALVGKRTAAGIESFLAREHVKRTHNDSPSIDLAFWAECGGKRLGGEAKASIGKKIVFKFRANVDGYCTIIDIQPSGDVAVLFPNDQQPDNRVIADREYSIPSADDAFEITITEPTGTDTIAAFFTRSRVDWLDRKKLTGEGFRTVPEGERLSMSRGLTVNATKIKAADWESKTISIEVIR